MKKLILILGCLLLVVPCQSAEKQPEPKKEAAQQIENQQKRLEEIEKYISRLRGDIEQYYRGQLIELTHRTESEIRLLEVAEKASYSSSSSVAAWAGSVARAIEMAKQTTYTSLHTGLAVQADVARAVLHINNYGHRAPWYLENKIESMLHLKGRGRSFRDSEDRISRSTERFVVAKSLIAKRKTKILAKMEWEAINLEKQREYALTVALVELEKQLKEEALKPKPKATHGVVTGILYCADGPLAIVDGKVVHEGDIMHGVKVVKIYKDKVDFAKNGKKWEQQVRQRAGAYWK